MDARRSRSLPRDALSDPIEILATQDEAPADEPEALHSEAASWHSLHNPAHSMHSAPTLAIVPHSSNPVPGYARPPWHRASPFAASPPTTADLFAAIHRLEECVHTLTVNQRGMALQLSNLHTSFAELQRITSSLEQRLVRQRELQDELDSNAYSAHSRVEDLQSQIRSQGVSLQALQDHLSGHSTNFDLRLSRLRTAQDELDNTAHNAHERISEVQSSVHRHSLALQGLQDTLGQASTDIRQLRHRIGHAMQVMGTHLAED